MKFLRSLVILILLQVLLNAQAASKKSFKFNSLSKSEAIQIVSKLTTIMDGYSANLYGNKNLGAEKIVQTWGWDEFKDWCSDSYNKTKEWVKGDDKKNAKTQTCSRLNYNSANKIVKAWGWDDFKDWCSDSYNKTKEWAKDGYEKGKDWAVSQALIQQKIMKFVKTKSDADLSDDELAQIDKDLEVLGPLFTALMEWGINYYFVVKQEVKYQMELYYDAKGVVYADLLFEKFEVAYIQQLFEEVRPVYELLYVTEGQEAVEQIEQELLLSYGFYLEPATIEEIEHFFDSIYQTELFKQVNTLKQEQAQNVTFEERLSLVLWDLYIQLGSDLQAYKQSKAEVLSQIEQEFGSNSSEQARVIIGNQEIDWIRNRFEEKRLQFEVAAIFGYTEDAKQIENQALENLNGVLEPVAIEVLKELFAKIYEIQKANTLEDALVQIQSQLKQALESIFLSIYRELKTGIIAGIQFYYGDEGATKALQAIRDFEVQWVNETLTNNKYWIEVNLEWNGVKGHQKAKQGFIEYYNNTLEPEAIEVAEEFYDQYTDELYEALEQVRPIFEEALNMGPEVYGELKRQTLEIVELEQPELSSKTRLLFGTFEIEYITVKLEEMRPLLELAMAFGGKAEIEKAEQEILDQVYSIFDYNTIREIESFFDSIYALEQTEAQTEEVASLETYKSLKLFKQAEEDESCDNDECDADECDADELDADELDADEEVVEELEVELLRKLKNIHLFQQAEEEEVFDADALDADSLDADELDADELDADELDADELDADEEEADLEVELLRKLKNLHLFQQAEEEEVFDADELDADELDADELDADALDADEEVVADLEVQLLRKLKSLHLFKQEDEDDDEDEDEDEEDFDALDADEIDGDEAFVDEAVADEDAVDQTEAQVLLMKELNSGTKIVTPSVEMQSPSYFYYFSLIGIISLIIVGLYLLTKRSKQSIVGSKNNNVYKLFKKEKDIEEHLL